MIDRVLGGFIPQHLDRRSARVLEVAGAGDTKNLGDIPPTLVRTFSIGHALAARSRIISLGIAVEFPQRLVASG